MNQQWQKSTFRILFWICAEIVLNLLNLDTLSDYSEFLLEQQIYDHRPKMVLDQDFVMVSPISFGFQLRFHRFQIAST